MRFADLLCILTTSGVFGEVTMNKKAIIHAPIGYWILRARLRRTTNPAKFRRTYAQICNLLKQHNIELAQQDPDHWMNQLSKNYDPDELQPHQSDYAVVTSITRRFIS